MSDIHVEFGRRIRLVRQRAGLSLRDAAQLTGISKNTILKLERGTPIRDALRSQLCARYGILDLKPGDAPFSHVGTGWAMHLATGEQWQRIRPDKEESPRRVSTSTRFQDPAERRNQGNHRFANQFICRLGVDRPNGLLRAAILEVFNESGWAKQLTGEAFIYVLEGALRVHIGTESTSVPQGSAIAFDRTIPHRHEPCPSLQPRQLPVRILYVQTDGVYKGRKPRSRENI